MKSKWKDTKINYSDYLVLERINNWHSPQHFFV